MLTSLLKTAIINDCMKDKNVPWHRRLSDNLVQLRTWLIPGMGVKRWFVLILFGTTLLGVDTISLPKDCSVGVLTQTPEI